MNYFRSGICLIIIVAFLAPISAAPAFAGGEVPLKGRCTGDVSVTLLPDSLYRLEYSASGTISHLGKVDVMWASPAVELDLNNRLLIVKSPEWTGTVTAADGDQIFWKYTFESDTIPFTLTGDLSAEAVLEATGGTGRFEGVTGYGVSFVKANIFTLSFSIDLEGEISSVGSSKR